MIGLKITHNKKEVACALDSGIISVLLTNKSGNYRITCAGTDENSNSYTWYGENVKPGDSISACFSHLRENDLCRPISTKMYASAYNEKKWLLQEYIRMKQELIEEGLLPSRMHQ